MIIHKCDKCGKDMSVWFDIEVHPNSAFLLSNVGGFLPYSGEYELCKTCFENLYETIKGGSNAET